MKRTLKLTSLVTLLILFLFGPLRYANAETVKDIPYGTLLKQKLDIYTPKRARNAPVMISVHGGGWHIGDKKNVQRKPAAFNREGYIYVSVGYPLLPDHLIETQASSVAKAINWVHQNIEAYGGDPSNIHTMGHSAGAHLVSLVAIDPAYLQAEQNSTQTIKSVTSVDGATLNVPWRMKNLDDSGRFARRMFTQTFGTDPLFWDRYSPHNYITSTRAPPAFLFLLAEQRTVSNLAADGVVEHLRAAGGVAKHTIIKNRNHSSINRRMGTWRDPAFIEIINFIDTY